MTLLTEITAAADDVALDLRYATSRNFTGRPVYRRAACYLHPDAAVLLRRAVALARPLGYQLLIFDAFRPAEAQWALWAHTPDPAFLADPRRGSPHSMGAAIDLGLIDRATGAVLDMGTEFDAMVAQSRHGATDIGVDAQRNRAILLGLMTAAGWDFYSVEWWHYQLFRPRDRYPVLSDAAAGTAMM